MPARVEAASKPKTAIDALFQQILNDGVRAHLYSFYERQRNPGETLVAFLERMEATNGTKLAVLKFVDKEYILLEAARPLLSREGFVPELAAFLESAEPGWTPPPVAPGLAVDAAADEAPTVRHRLDDLPEPHRRSWDQAEEDALPPGNAPLHTASVGLRSYRRSWVEEDYDAEPEPQRLDLPAPTPQPEPGPVGDGVASTCVPYSSATLPTRHRPRGEDASLAERPTVESAADSSGFLPPGTRVGKYMIEALVGQGAFGVVYSSTHPTLRVPVAVKVIRSSLAHGDDRDRFQNEARLVAQLNHPALVRVWDYDDDEHGLPYLVLEYVDGATLDDLIRKKKQLPASAAIRIIRHVAQGLQEAARLGIVHKDVKPANILIARDGAVKLTDFGVATLSNSRLGKMLSIRADPNLICGTVYYMPPEQAQGDDVDSRADGYALGATLYHAVTGRLPYIGKTTAHVLLKQLRSPPTPPSELVPGLPKKVCEVILKMMARLASDRYQTYAELLSALDAAEASLAPRRLPASVPAWSAEAQAAADPPPPDAELSGSIWNWLKRGAFWFGRK